MNRFRPEGAHDGSPLTQYYLERVDGDETQLRIERPDCVTDGNRIYGTSQGGTR
jgi:hypothetical protein